MDTESPKIDSQIEPDLALSANALWTSLADETLRVSSSDREPLRMSSLRVPVEPVVSQPVQSEFDLAEPEAKIQAHEPIETPAEDLSSSRIASDHPFVAPMIESPLKVENADKIERPASRA